MIPGQWVVAHDQPFTDLTRAHVVARGAAIRRSDVRSHTAALSIDRDLAPDTALAYAACGRRLTADHLYADADRHPDVERCHDCAQALAQEAAS